MKQVALAELKDHLSNYLRAVEKEQIVITRHGKPAGVLIGFGSEDDWFEYKLENDPRFLSRTAKARESIRGRRGIPWEEIQAEQERRTTRGMVASAALLGKVGGQELGGGLDGHLVGGEVARVPGHEAGRVGAQRAEELDGVLEVLEARVDGLVEDLLVEGHGDEGGAQQPDGPLRGATVPQSPNDVVDVREADDGDQSSDGAAFGQRPYLGGVVVERVPLRQNIQQDVGVAEDVHGSSPYLSSSASSRTFL